MKDGAWTRLVARIKEGLRELRQGEARAALVLLSISLIPLILFSIVPMINCFRYAFTDFSIVAKSTDWVGLANFQEAIEDELFWKMWKNTFTYTAMVVPTQMIMGLFFALLLDRKIRGISALRTVYYLPSLTSGVAIGFMFKFLFHPTYGFLNRVLDAIGLPTLLWLDDPSTALLSLAIAAVWQGFGSTMIIYLAGLQGIPQAFYEAAAIDGANWWQKVVSITVPLLRPVTFYLLVTGVIGALQVYDTVMVMTYDPRGGPLDSTTTVVFSIYQNAAVFHRLGYASALSLILFVVIMILTWVNFKVGGEHVQY
jgi:multiple sugar transport system permease protein